MKVGYFVETPVEHNLTGGVRSFLNLVEELLKLGVEPYVVTSEEWTFTDKLKEMGIPYLTSKMLRPFVGVEEHTRFEREKYWVKTAINHCTKYKAIKWFKKSGVELVHVNSQFAGIIGSQVAEKMHIPCVYHIREYLEEHFRVRFYKEKLIKKYVASADRIVAISKAIQMYHEKRFGRELDLIYNGIPYNEKNCFNYDSRLQGDTLHLAIVGRITPGKGQFEAIQAIEILKSSYGMEKLCLHIIGYMGTDPYELAMKDYAYKHDLGKNVVFHPFTNTPEEILKNCDVGLTCSVAEAFGRVTVEYMLAGLFTIGTNTGGTPEIILDNETGLLYEQGNAQELAEKIHWVLQNKEKAKEMLRAGQDRAKTCFSIHATAKSIYTLYKELI